MKTLFVHQNFPGQFKHLAPALARSGHDVRALAAPKARGLSGVEMHTAFPRCTTGQDGHPWSRDFDTKIIRGEAAYRAALAMRESGFSPDVIVAHPGWGESLFLKQVWPHARLGIYCEWHYNPAQLTFDPEFPVQESEDAACRMMSRNVSNYIHFRFADAGISPTQWQASTFPSDIRQRIEVIHDGVDTDIVRPAGRVRLRIGKDLEVATGDEIVTFINRNLEPSRGYHVFMRSLPELLRRRPKARVLIIGGNDVSYGAKPEAGTSWRTTFYNEVRSEIDTSRVHFFGRIPYKSFVALMQITRVHVYLTYPFVLSWSLLEAMSAGAAVVASDTPPLREVIVDGENGRLFPFFDRGALVDRVCELLVDHGQRQALGHAAREHVRAHYDLSRICLPRQLEWIDQLYQSAPREAGF